MSVASQTGSTSATNNANTSSTTSSGTQVGSDKGFNSLNTQNFLALLINQLQNQDPLEPTDNAALIQQIGQIRSIGATDSLTGTLTNLTNSQQLVTASGLIGRTVQGLANDKSDVTGVVDRITVETNKENQARSIKVHVGQKTIEVQNIRDIRTG